MAARVRRPTPNRTLAKRSAPLRKKTAPAVPAAAKKTVRSKATPPRSSKAAAQSHGIVGSPLPERRDSPAAERNNNVGDDAVLAGSGRGWSEWFGLLDDVGAHRWKHKDIAAYLYDELECPGWWNQMVAVGYEQARGLRAVNQAAGGFQVSCSRTIAAPVSVAYAAWSREAQRKRWLGSVAITVRTSTPEKSMRITWTDGTSSVDVYFLSKGAGRSQVNVQHRKLASARDVASMRGFWSDALERLRHQLES